MEINKNTLRSQWGPNCTNVILICALLAMMNAGKLNFVITWPNKYPLYNKLMPITLNLWRKILQTKLLVVTINIIFSLSSAFRCPVLDLCPKPMPIAAVLQFRGMCCVYYPLKRRDGRKPVTLDWTQVRALMLSCPLVVLSCPKTPIYDGTGDRYVQRWDEMQKLF